MQASNAVSKDTPQTENSASQPKNLNPSHRDNPKNFGVRAIHPLSDEYLSTEQVAQVLKTNPQVIKDSRQRGKLFGRKPPEFIRIGERKLLYKASEIVRWIESGKHGHVSGAES